MEDSVWCLVPVMTSVFGGLLSSSPDKARHLTGFLLNEKAFFYKRPTLLNKVHTQCRALYLDYLSTLQRDPVSTIQKGEITFSENGFYPIPLAC